MWIVQIKRLINWNLSVSFPFLPCPFQSADAYCLCIWTNQRYAEQTEFAGYTAALPVPLEQVPSRIVGRWWAFHRPCLVSFLRGKASSFSPFNRMLVVGFYKYSLLSWRSSFLFWVCWVFIMNGGWIWSTVFLSVDKIIWFVFFFSLYSWYVSLHRISDVKPDLHTWSKSNLIMESLLFGTYKFRIVMPSLWIDPSSIL